MSVRLDRVAHRSWSPNGLLARAFCTISTRVGAGVTIAALLGPAVVPLLGAAVVSTLVTAVVMIAPEAEAAKPKDRPIAIYLEGPNAEAIGGDVVAALPEGLKVTNPDDYKDALAKAGQKGPLGKGLDGDKSKAKLAEKIRKAAEASKVYAVLVVRVSPAPKGQTKVRFVLFETDSDLIALDKEITVPAKGKKKAADYEKDRAAMVADAVVDPLKKLVPEPEPEPVAKEEEEPAAKTEPEAKDEKPEEPTGARPKNDPAHSLFEIGGGVDIGFRTLSFDGKGTPNVRGYSVGGTPGVAIAGELYPLAGTMNALGDFGITVMYARALALKSAPAGGEKLDTTWSRYDIGLRYRIRTGEKLPIIGLGVGIGNETFSIDASGPLADEVPSANYKFIRAGLDLRVPIGGLALFGGGNFLAVSSGGDTGDRFRETKITGFDFFLGAGYMLVPGLEARIAGRYRKMSYTFSSQSGDAFIATGAGDALSSLTIGAAYIF